MSFDVWAPNAFIRKMLPANSLDTGETNNATISGLAVAVYKDANTNETTDGVSVSANYDGRTGLILITIDPTANTGFYSVGSHFFVVVTAGTVNGRSLVNKVLYDFTISHLPNAASMIVGGTVGSGSTTTSIVTSWIGVEPGSTTQFKGKTIMFLRPSSTGLPTAGKTVTLNTVSATPTLTLEEALPVAPIAGDMFILV